MVEAFRRRLAFDPTKVPPFARLVPLRLSPSYIIYIEDTTIKALNCQTGEVEFSGTDASTVIQSAIDALPAEGGEIFICGGTYKFTKGLRIAKNNVTIRGEGRSTVFATDGMDESFIYVGHTAEANHFTLSDLMIDGKTLPKTAGVEVTLDGHGVVIDSSTYDCKRWLIERVYFTNMPNESVAVYGDAERPMWGIIRDCTFEGKVYRAFHGHWDVSAIIIGNAFINMEEVGNVIRHANIIANNAFIRVSGDRAIVGADHGGAIIGNYFSRCNLKIGIETWGGTGGQDLIIGNVFSGIEAGFTEEVIRVGKARIGNHIVGNQFYWIPAAKIVIRVIDCKKVLVADNVFVNCGEFITVPHSWIRLEADARQVYVRNNVFYHDKVNPPDYFIEELTGTNENCFEENHFEGAAVSPLKIVGALSKARRNIGYVTENSGVATFSGDGTTTSFSWAHGLVSTPTKILVTPKSVDASGNFYVTADATNITITYITAPPAGTDNVVLSWYAEV